MTWLWEDPWPLLGIGGLILLVLGVVFFNTRRMLFAGIMALVALAMLGLFVLEAIVITPREEVENSVQAAADALTEANNPQATLAWIAPEATSTRQSVETVLGYAKFTATKVTDVQISINDSLNPPEAAVTLLGRADYAGQGIGTGTVLRRVTCVWRREPDGRWLLLRYDLRDPLQN